MGKLCMDLYVKKLQARYLKAKKSEKSVILKEFCDTSGYHKKHAIRILNTKPSRRKKVKKRQGRPPLYKPERCLQPLKEIWLACDQPCGKRLKEAIPYWLPHYADTYSELEKSLYDELIQMSASTIDRLLKPLRAKHKRSWGGTKPGSILKNQIPVQTEQWDIEKPGFIEADTVAHCGVSLTGNFIWSLTLTDIYSGWTELRAIWNKGSAGVVEQIEDFEKRLPFPILGFDCDNGSEFLNWHLIRYFSDAQDNHRIQFTRSRPYHKDDNAHVEQKNWTHVRQLLGYYRLDKQSLVWLINDLYRNEISMLNNFFMPNFKLIHKQRDGAKIIKKHDKPETPYHRLLKSEQVTEQKKNELKLIYEQANPFVLKKAIQIKLKRIFANIDMKNRSKRTNI